MFDINPEWITASAEAVAAVENGIGMCDKKDKNAAATPATPSGITGQDFLIGMLILAAAMLAAAWIDHCGSGCAQLTSSCSFRSLRTSRVSTMSNFGGSVPPKRQSMREGRDIAYDRMLERREARRARRERR
jgi:hypothetical protein